MSVSSGLALGIPFSCHLSPLFLLVYFLLPALSFCLSSSWSPFLWTSLFLNSPFSRHIYVQPFISINLSLSLSWRLWSLASWHWHLLILMSLDLHMSSSCHIFLLASLSLVSSFSSHFLLATSFFIDTSDISFSRHLLSWASLSFDISFSRHVSFLTLLTLIIFSLPPVSEHLSTFQRPELDQDSKVEKKVRCPSGFTKNLQGKCRGSPRTAALKLQCVEKRLDHNNAPTPNFKRCPDALAFLFTSMGHLNARPLWKWGFPWPWGYPNSWMVYNGKSHMDDDWGYPHLWRPRNRGIVRPWSEIVTRHSPIHLQRHVLYCETCCLSIHLSKSHFVVRAFLSKISRLQFWKLTFLERGTFVQGTPMRLWSAAKNRCEKGETSVPTEAIKSLWQGNFSKHFPICKYVHMLHIYIYSNKQWWK